MHHDAHDALLIAMAQASQRTWDITQRHIDDWYKIFETVPKRGIVNGVVESDAIVLDATPLDAQEVTM